MQSGPLARSSTTEFWLRLFAQDSRCGWGRPGRNAGGSPKFHGKRRTTTAIGEWIETTCGINYTRSAIIKLLKRLGMVYREPKALPRKLDRAKQAAFFKEYEDLLNGLADDETVMFADTVHPTHEARPAGCWAPNGQRSLWVAQPLFRPRA